MENLRLTAKQQIEEAREVFKKYGSKMTKEDMKQHLSKVEKPIIEYLKISKDIRYIENRFEDMLRWLNQRHFYKELIRLAK